jgi:TDG/mug DNA glycosylase family protein
VRSTKLRQSDSRAIGDQAPPRWLSADWSFTSLVSVTEAPWKPSKQQLQEAVDKTVPDLVAPDLDVLFVGINPGLYTAAIGHHFGRPGNRFWKVLHLSGFTPRQFSPFEERELLKHGVGVTNMVPRTTATAAELSPDEIVEGGKRLIKLVKKYKPQTIAVLGVQAYRRAFDVPRAQVGLQDETLADAPVWVLPNPSGLQAHYQLPDMVELFEDVRASLR